MSKKKRKRIVVKELLATTNKVKRNLFKSTKKLYFVPTLSK